MSKKTPPFVADFLGDYIGDSRDAFAANLYKQIGRAKEFLKLCNADLDFVINQLKLHDSQEARRSFIRTIPPWVEGSLTFLRVTVFLYPPLLDRLPKDCLVLFAETMLPLRNRSSAKETIKQTFVGIGKLAGMEVSSHLMGESGAQALMNMFDLRNSLMHPRSIKGYLVSDESIRSAYIGIDWFNHKFVAVFSPMLEVAKDISGHASGDA